MSNVLAKIYLNDIYIGQVTAFQLEKMNKEMVDRCFYSAIQGRMYDSVKRRLDEMKASMTTRARTDGESTLSAAYLAAIEQSDLSDIRVMRLISLDVLDGRLPRTKKGKKISGRGWWTTLEGDEDTVEVKGYVFVPMRKKEGRSVGKHNEGVLLDVSKNKGLSSLPFHSYSIKDKRYLSKFKTRVVDDTVRNKFFMDAVMKDMCLKIHSELAKLPKEEKVEEATEEDSSNNPT